MTNRESEILKYLKANPLISQKELADILGITRSSVAVHITNLTKKGLILGKGYIMNEEPYVLVIGGCNIDIQGAPVNALKLNDSNPGTVSTSLGGVGRNICENIARLNVSTGLISLVGDDVYGVKIIDHANAIGIDTQGLTKVSNMSTSTYLSVLDETGDMKVAIAHMDIINEVTVDYIKGFADYIKNSKYCVLDTNLPQEVLEYLLSNFECQFILDCVSSTKALKVKKLIGKFHTIKPNKIEAEILSGIKINTIDDVKAVVDHFHGLGVMNIFISLGSDGVYYSNGKESGQMAAKDINVISATGAGDAFIAGITYSYMNEFDLTKSVRYAIGASVLALESKETINQELCKSELENRVKKINYIDRR